MKIRKHKIPLGRRQKIKVTFDEEGGGDDFEDVYIYWIHKEKYSMDYLAYSFHIT